MNLILIIETVVIGMAIITLILLVILVLEEDKNKDNKSNSSTKWEYMYIICLITLGLLILCLGIIFSDNYNIFSGLIFIIIGGLHLRGIKERLSKNKS